MIDDLFGHVPQQNSPVRETAPARPIEHTPLTIRALMREILAEARSANTLPWTPRKLRSHTAAFPYMAEWLPADEGERLMGDLKAELERLRAPVDQVAPNWRRIWEGVATRR